jgi:UDP-N-acetylglucosamine transferase subunit ALG13
MSTFVTVGNAKQPFRRLLDAVAVHAALLPRPVIVQHGHNPFAAENCQAVAFLGMEEFTEQIRRAEIVIMHAGAGSVIHAIEAGKRPIVVPRRVRYGEHVNDHQVELARALSEIDKVIVVEEPDELPGAVRRLIEDRAWAAQGAASLVGSREPRIVALVRNALLEFESSLRDGERAR